MHIKAKNRYTLLYYIGVRGEKGEVRRKKEKEKRKKGKGRGEKGMMRG